MMESQAHTEEKPVNKNRPLIIIVAVVLALCCCLVVVAVVGFYSFTRIASIETSQTEPFEEFVLPSDSELDGPPEGGLANDILKNDTWQVMASAAAGLGCDEPSGAGMKIEVLQQPSDGIWVEKWPVMCQSGEVYEFEVEFILDNSGATFNIRLMQ
jgi:hypothetical protein